MKLASEHIEERRRFTPEERKAILKRTHGICACCGKKLTTKTMTIDHVIPISRGGTNDIENLIALCEADNKAKGNLLYLPIGFYTALTNKPEFVQLNQHFINWFDTVKEQFDITKFPMLAPNTRLLLSLPGVPLKKATYSPQLLYEWTVINRTSYHEVEETTGLNLQQVRKETASMWELPDPHPELHTPIVPLYVLRKCSTGKITAVVAVQLYPKQKFMNVYIPWSDCSNQGKPSILYNLVRLLLNIVSDVAKCEIDSYGLVAPDEYYVKAFVDGRKIPSNMGGERRYGRVNTGDVLLHIVNVIRNKLPQIRPIDETNINLNP